MYGLISPIYVLLWTVKLGGWFLSINPFNLTTKTYGGVSRVKRDAVNRRMNVCMQLHVKIRLKYVPSAYATSLRINNIMRLRDQYAMRICNQYTQDTSLIHMQVSIDCNLLNHILYSCVNKSDMDIQSMHQIAVNCTQH